MLTTRSILQALVHLVTHSTRDEQRMIRLVSRTSDGTICSVIELGNIVETARVMVPRVGIGTVVDSGAIGSRS